MALFEKGHSIKGGGRKGIRNRLSNALLEELATEFEQYGGECVRICRIEKPVEFLKLVAGLLPKECDLVIENRLADISDDELDSIIELARQRRAITINADGREKETVNGEPTRLLQTVSKAGGVSHGGSKPSRASTSSS